MTNGSCALSCYIKNFKIITVTTNMTGDIVEVLEPLLHYCIPNGELAGEDICNLKLCSKRTYELVDWKMAAAWFEHFDHKKSSNWVSCHEACDDCGTSGFRLRNASLRQTICLRCRGIVELNEAMEVFDLCDVDRMSLPIALARQKKTWGHIYVTDLRSVVGRSILRYGETTNELLAFHLTFWPSICRFGLPSVVRSDLNERRRTPSKMRPDIDFETPLVVVHRRKHKFGGLGRIEGLIWRVQKLTRRSIRRCRVLKELSRHGLRLRWDSRLCEAYMDGKFKDITEVGLMMAEMKWLVEHTQYLAIVRQMYANSFQDKLIISLEAKQVVLAPWIDRMGTVPANLKARFQCRLDGGCLGHVAPCTKETEAFDCKLCNHRSSRQDMARCSDRGNVHYECADEKACKWRVQVRRMLSVLV